MLKNYLTEVPGRPAGEIWIFALSTCSWCRKVRKFLDGLGVAYRYVDVDLTTGAARAEVVKELDRWNPQHSFPTVVINNEKCLVGYDEEDLRKALKIGKT